MAQMALRWCLDHEAVSTVIPGASSPEQARRTRPSATCRRCPTSCTSGCGRFYLDRVAAQHPRAVLTAQETHRGDAEDAEDTEKRGEGIVNPRKTKVTTGGACMPSWVATG